MNDPRLYFYRAVVSRWVDGDTIDLQVDVGFNQQANVRFRLLGVDTPERGQNNFNEAREMCERMYPIHSEVIVQTFKQGKWGRWLVDMSDVREALINSGLGVPYEA